MNAANEWPEKESNDGIKCVQETSKEFTKQKRHHFTVSALIILALYPAFISLPAIFNGIQFLGISC